MFVGFSRGSGVLICAMLFAVALFAWPLLVLYGVDNPSLEDYTYVFALCTAMIGSYIFTFIRTSSSVLNYWEGSCYIVGSWMTGCLNVTFVIVLPILFIVHLISLALAIISIAAGRAFAQRTFVRLVHSFSRRRFDLKQALDYIDAQQTH
jgi:hypothetical protein